MTAVYFDTDTTVYEIDVPTKVTSAMQLSPMMPDYTDTIIPRQFAVAFKVTPKDAVWLNPLGHSGVAGKIIYTAVNGQPLTIGNLWLRKVRNTRPGVQEPLKLLPLAAMDGDVAAFPYQTATRLGSINSAALHMQWVFSQGLHLEQPISFEIQHPQKFRKAYQSNYSMGDLRITASHNPDDVKYMLDGDLATSWSTKQNMAAGMYLEIESLKSTGLRGLCLWLGGDYISYPTMFKVLWHRQGDTFEEVPYHFSIVGQPNKPLENRIDIMFERYVRGKIRIEILKPPLEGKWWWNVGELEPYY